MSLDTASEVKLEIGHVLFIDIVGYSNLLITQQSEQLETLRQIARGTEQFRLAEAEGKLLGLPTGDGGALVFRSSPEAPVLCAMETSKELKRHPEIQVRMGIHSGPVNEITDLNAQANIAGAGINIAQRVMDCGDDGHILLSQHVADDLEQYPRWRPLLHALGEGEVNHGVTVHLFNLYGDDVGNPAVPGKVQSAARLAKKSSRVPLFVAATIVALGVIAAAFYFSRRPAQSGAAVTDKSIAVLPFVNMSEDKANEFFSDGISEELLNL